MNNYRFKNVQVLYLLENKWFKGLFDDLPDLDKGYTQVTDIFECLDTANMGNQLFLNSRRIIIADLSVLLHVPEEIKLSKAPRRTTYDIAIIHLIIDQLCKSIKTHRVDIIS